MSTTLATMQNVPDSVLGRMFDTDSQFGSLLRDDQEAVFIDADPEAFRVVLNYLPPSTVPSTPVGSATLVAGECRVAHWRLSTYRPRGGAARGEAAAREAHREALRTHRGELQARAPGRGPELSPE